jgi:hypothetical protein
METTSTLSATVLTLDFLDNSYTESHEKQQEKNLKTKKETQPVDEETGDLFRTVLNSDPSQFYPKGMKTTYSGFLNKDKEKREEELKRMIAERPQEVENLSDYMKDVLGFNSLFEDQEFNNEMIAQSQTDDLILSEEIFKEQSILPFKQDQLFFAGLLSFSEKVLGTENERNVSKEVFVQEFEWVFMTDTNACSFNYACLACGANPEYVRMEFMRNLNPKAKKALANVQKAYPEWMAQIFTERALALPKSKKRSIKTEDDDL